jgi:phage terminase large subunit
MNTSVLFNSNYHSTAHTVINQGGTSSGKTFSIMQALFCFACEQEKQVITVVGQDIPNLKSGVMRDAAKIHQETPELLRLVKSFNATDRIFNFTNSSGTVGQTGTIMGITAVKTRCFP